MTTRALGASLVARRPVMDAAHLRTVLGHVPTSVCVVTTIHDGIPFGSTIGSFTSVSLDPPLVAFFSMHGSSLLGAIREAGCFAVNVLAADQAETGRAFARRGERFGHVVWRPGAQGTPHIGGSLAILDCEVEQLVALGDHEMVVGRVRHLEAKRDVAPLTFCRGLLQGLPVPETPAAYYQTWLDE